MTPDNDIINNTRWATHGGNPDKDDNITRLETGLDDGLGKVEAHSATLKDRNSLGYDQLTDLIAGKTGNLDVYDEDKH